MTIAKENMGVLYETVTGKIIQNIRLPKDLKVMDEVYLDKGHSILVGERALDVDLYKVEAGQLVEGEAPTTDLSKVKRMAKEYVDRVAGVLRAEHITVAMGQAETYLAKELEARKFIEDPAPNNSDYPMLSAEVGVSGSKLSDVAQSIVSKANDWKHLAGAIEAVRLGAKQQIDAATSDNTVQVVLDGISWPQM